MGKIITHTSSSCCEEWWTTQAPDKHYYCCSSSCSFSWGYSPGAVIQETSMNESLRVNSHWNISHTETVLTESYGFQQILTQSSPFPPIPHCAFWNYLAIVTNLSYKCQLLWGRLCSPFSPWPFPLIVINPPPQYDHPPPHAPPGLPKSPLSSALATLLHDLQSLHDSLVSNSCLSSILIPLSLPPSLYFPSFHKYLAHRNTKLISELTEKKPKNKLNLCTQVAYYLRQNAR